MKMNVLRCTCMRLSHPIFAIWCIIYMHSALASYQMPHRSTHMDLLTMRYRDQCLRLLYSPSLEITKCWHKAFQNHPSYFFKVCVLFPFSPNIPNQKYKELLVIWIFTKMALTVSWRVICVDVMWLMGAGCAELEPQSLQGKKPFGCNLCVYAYFKSTNRCWTHGSAYALVGTIFAFWKSKSQMQLSPQVWGMKPKVYGDPGVKGSAGKTAEYSFSPTYCALKSPVQQSLHTQIHKTLPTFVL